MHERSKIKSIRTHPKIKINIVFILGFIMHYKETNIR